MPVRKTSTARTDAIDIAREIGHTRAQTSPIHKMQFFTFPWCAKSRALAPADMARELTPRLRRALLWVNAGYCISARTHNTLWRLNLVHSSFDQTRRRKSSLTAAGRAVAWCLGACTHDDPIDGPHFERTYSVGGTVMYATRICQKCGAWRRCYERKAGQWAFGEWEAWTDWTEWARYFEGKVRVVGERTFVEEAAP